MQNKGVITLIAILFGVACLYQLSFTLVTKKVEKNARIYANGDHQKEAKYIDSIASVEVFKLGIKNYTYRECQEREINLGLDLKGGMNVMLEISLIDLIKNMSGNSTDSTFLNAIQLASKNQEKSNKDFLTLFAEAFETLDPNAQLNTVFRTPELSKKITYKTTNDEVIDIIRKEAEGAIDNTFNVLRNRIDHLGVVQPNIQKLEYSGRILIELPGIKDQKRVRKLLQSTANLEFWETWDNKLDNEMYAALLKANDIIKEIETAESDKLDVAESDTTEDADADIVSDTTKGLSLVEQLKKDTLSKDTSLAGGFATNFPLFNVLKPSSDNTQLFSGSIIGRAHYKDTTKINYWLKLKQVRALFPTNIKFLWSIKAVEGDASKSVYELHAIKITRREGKAPLTGDAVTDAYMGTGNTGAQAQVDMTMNAEGAKIWARMTKENVGRCIAIVLDNYVYSSPRVQNEISGGSSQITGNFTIQEATDLANVLKSGKMPAPARIIQEAVVGPSLGKESINAGFTSFTIAFIGVLLYMWLYYARAGNVANLALFANVFYLLGVFASLGIVLTLPGIAGIVLTLAMAVDGNVIIYERMREEVRAGKGSKLVVKDGFWHAYSAIIDGHVTTILTGIVLFLFGSGPVQGFATALIAGLLISLFTSIFIARLVFEFMLKKDFTITLGNKFTLNAFSKMNIDFIKLRKKAYVISLVVISIMLISIFVRGLDPGIDFVGGRTYVVRFDKPVKTNDIRTSLTQVFNTAPEVKTFGTNNQVKITTKFMIEDKSIKTDSIVDIKLYEGLESFFTTPISYTDFSEHSDTKEFGELSSERVDPVMSTRLIYQAFMAVFFGLIMIFIYIAIRFRNWKYGLGGVISLFHDTLIVIGVFSLLYKILPFNLEIDQSFIAALLTIIGYSIMDTVIIFDRIREYNTLYVGRPLRTNINNAINSTIGRTINTSGTTMLVLITIFIFGGEIIRGFIFALMIGVAIGTYSSVFTATPIAYDIIKFAEKRKKDKK